MSSVCIFQIATMCATSPSVSVYFCPTVCVAFVTPNTSRICKAAEGQSLSVELTESKKGEAKQINAAEEDTRTHN